MSSKPIMSGYFRADLDERGEMRGAREARRVHNDIVAVVLSPDTPVDERLECLKHVAMVLCKEMADTRQQEVNLNVELAASADTQMHIQEELDAVQKLVQAEAGAMARQFGGGALGRSAFINFDETKGVNLPDVNVPRHTTSPASGRSTPLLSTSSEEIMLPTRPHSVHCAFHNRTFSVPRGIPIEPPPDMHAKRANPNRLSDVQERIKYKYELTLRVNKLRHRVHTMKQLMRVFDDEDSHSMSAADIQLAFFYCLYSSREVRKFVCKRSAELRAKHLAPLHPSKCYDFMNALNKLSEDYYLDKISSAVYLTSLRHMHTFNFCHIYENGSAERALSRSASASSLSLSGHSRRASEINDGASPATDAESSADESVKKAKKDVHTPTPHRPLLARMQPILTASADETMEGK